MPLTPTAKKVLAKFHSEYGGKEGTSHFYALANKNAKFAKAVGETKRKRKK